MVFFFSKVMSLFFEAFQIVCLTEKYNFIGSAFTFDKVGQRYLTMTIIAFRAGLVKNGSVKINVRIKPINTL